MQAKKIERPLKSSYTSGQKYGENTIKEIILGKNELSQNLTHDSHSFLLREIIEIAKYESIFANDIIDTFYNVFLTSQDKWICRGICKYLMRYTIYKFYQQNTLNEIQNSIREFLKLIFTNAVTNKLETLVYLSDFLGSERGAYKEFLDERVYHEVKEICDIIWGELSEERIDKISEVASQLILKIKSLKDTLDTIGSFSFAEESVNIKEEFERRKDNYRAWAGNNIELSMSMQDEELRVLKSLWDKVDNFILNSLEIFRDKGLGGQYSLMAEHDSRSVQFFLISKFSDSGENWQETSVNIEDKFAADICNRGLKSSFTKQTTGFIGWIVFETVEKPPSSFFNNLLDFLESTLWLPVRSGWWKQVESLVKDEISLELPDIQEKLVSHTLVQIDKLSKKTKDLLKVFLNIPHDLKNLITTSSPKEMRIRIRRAKNDLRNISFFQKDFLFPDGEERTISIGGLISSVRREFEYPIKVSSLQKEVSIHIHPENDEFPLIDYYANSEEHIKMMFTNLFYNAYDSLKKKICQSPEDFKPEIRISISMENDYYKILFSDNGVGLSEGANKEASTGVGHAIISTLAQHYKGEFKNIPSEEGATFLIKLPISQNEKEYKEIRSSNC
ncbi:MAG: hypothetical protein DDT18_00736 [Actinobacteria bacterium]|nr:hypothetical protein [Actinomycetota bacterium]